ncbi:MAG: chemotaxis protein CheW [Gammaproteobacteria bacterium]|nr:chemotaxis protein CheW [Gammaproteobacteria bacterium]
MTTTQAWLLECGESLSIAIGFNEMVELLQNQNSYSVPGSPGYCSRVLIWQESTVVPVMDITSLHSEDGENHENPYICLLKYQQAPQMPLQYLALLVNTPPRRIEIDDDQACELPEEIVRSTLQPVAVSCFLYEDKPVVILDLTYLCSAEFRDLAYSA